MLKKYYGLVSLFLLIGIAFIGFSTFAQKGTAEADVMQREAVIKEIKGSVEVKKRDTKAWIAARKDMILGQNDVIKTSAVSWVDILIPTEGEKSTVRVYENTEVAIKRLVKYRITGEENTTLDVAVGKILIKAAKLKGESKFEVVTPTSIVGVRGTQFEVTVSAPE